MMDPMPWLAEDRARLDAFRRGERPTLTDTYRHYSPAIADILAEGFSFESGDRRLHFSGFHSPFDLDDALQETFLKAFAERSRLAYDGLRPYRAYLATIARNAVIDRFRKSGRRERLFQQIVGDAAPPPAADHSLAESQLRQLIATFKATCSPVDQQLIVLRFEQNATRAAVSEATGLSAMQVRTRETKLRRALYDTLVGHGFGPTDAALILIALGSGCLS